MASIKIADTIRAIRAFLFLIKIDVTKVAAIKIIQPIKSSHIQLRYSPKLSINLKGASYQKHSTKKCTKGCSRR